MAENRTEKPKSASLHGRAEEDLRFIRETMEKATAFTAVSGWGAVVIGLIALAAAPLAARLAPGDGWLVVWLVAAVMAVAVAVFATRRKSRSANIPLHDATMRKLTVSFGAPILAGALLTLAFYGKSHGDVLPGIWLLLYPPAHRP